MKICLYLVVDKIIWLLFFKFIKIHLLRVQTNKQVESCFLNPNSSIYFCCTDSLLITHCGGLSLNIFTWRIGGGGQVSFCPGAQKFSWQFWMYHRTDRRIDRTTTLCLPHNGRGRQNEVNIHLYTEWTT